MAKLSGKGMLGIAAVLSLVTAMLVYNYLAGAVNKTAQNMLPVIIAKVDIPPKTRITADMIQISNVPAEYVQPGAVQDSKEILGMLVREPIVAGEQITNRRLFIEGKSGGFTGLIPIGKRAVTVAVTDVTGVAGFIKPGDCVDVAVTFDATTAGDYIGDVIIKNVLVLAVNHETEAGAVNSEKDKDKKEPVKTATVTLAVNAIDVHYLAVGDDRGKIRLALRPYLEEPGFTFTKPITARELMGRPPITEKQTAPPSTTENSMTERKRQYAEDNSVKPRRIESSSGVKSSGVEGKGIFMIRGTKVETVQVN